MTAQAAAGRRGRSAICPDPATGPAAEFAGLLWRLKRSAGDPSYDRMRSEYGALASKSALSAAARGQRLPSWDTTWEFVRVLEVGVLGRPEDQVRREWRARWEVARDRIGETSGETTGDVEAPETRSRPDRSRWMLATAVSVALLTAAFLVAGRVLERPDPSEPAVGPVPGPLVEGDLARFGRDVTLPDGAEVPTATHVVKTWEIHNGGTVPWIDRHLRREASFGSPDGCATPQQIPIPQTQPGTSVQISVDVRTPNTPGYCQVYWKMVDDQGRLVLPGQRAVYFLIEVVA